MQGFIEADYDEGLLFGYRWYDSQSLAPLFPFGHGLSYSTFAYSGLAVAGSVSASGISNATVYASVCNTGGPAGFEVAQLYIAFPAELNEPPQLLKGFSKVWLEPTTCGSVRFELSAADLQTWDVTLQVCSKSVKYSRRRFKFCITPSVRAITVLVTLDPNGRALICNAFLLQKYSVATGTYGLRIGSSSRDIRLTGNLSVSS